MGSSTDQVPDFNSNTGLHSTAHDVMGHEWFIALRSWLQHTSRFRFDAFARFVDQWMPMPRVCRKSLSYCGAIRATIGTPTHYKCTILGKNYFDPGNYCYSVAFDILYGKASPWNMETKGDIFEGMLGYHWQGEVIAIDEPTADIQIHRARQISSILNFVVDRVFRLIDSYKESAVIALGSIMCPHLAQASAPTPQMLRLPQRAKPKPLGDPRMPCLSEVAEFIRGGFPEGRIFNMPVEDFDDRWSEGADLEKQMKQ